MNAWKRLRNLWALSEFQPAPHHELKAELPTGTVVSPIIKVPEKAKFIPYEKINPIKRITEENA